MKRIFFPLPFILLVNFLFAQNPNVKQWDYRYGGTGSDDFNVLIQTFDNGYFLGGTSNSDSSGDKSMPPWGPSKYQDFWIVKLDSNGIMQWDKRYGGFAVESLDVICKTKDHCYILGGTTNSNISGDKSQHGRGGVDIWILKIDSIGNKIWDKRFGGNKTDFLFSVKQTKDGGYILGGSSESDSSGDKTQNNWSAAMDFWIIKTNSKGKKQWDKRFGGTGADYLKSIEQDKEGGYILGGSSISDSSGDKTQNRWGSNFDYWIVKTDSLGNKLWDKRFGGTSDDALSFVHQNSDGSYILAGVSSSGISGDKTQSTWGSPLDWDFWIVKTDSIGNKIWDKRFGGTSMEDGLDNFFPTNDGGFLLSGTSYSNISGDKSENNLGPEQGWIIKIDSTGNKVWDKTIFTNNIHDDENGKAIQSSDGCYVFANSTEADSGGYKTQLSRGWNDYWIIKFCDTNSYAQTPVAFFGSSDSTLCEKTSIDFFDFSFNNPTSWQWYFQGAMPDTSTAQNPKGVYYSTYGIFSVTLIATNAAGSDSVTVATFITVAQDPPAPLITISNDTLFSSPSFSYQWYFNNTLITNAIDSFYVFSQNGNFFVLITDSSGCHSASNAIATAIDVFESQSTIFNITPNPTCGNFIISYTGNDILNEIIITDAIGKIIIKKLNPNSIETFHLNVSDGIYFIDLKTENGTRRKKLLIQ